jgi:hypothetical protein
MDNDDDVAGDEQRRVLVRGVHARREREREVKSKSVGAGVGMGVGVGVWAANDGRRAEVTVTVRSSNANDNNDNNNAKETWANTMERFDRAAALHPSIHPSRSGNSGGGGGHGIASSVQKGIRLVGTRVSFWASWLADCLLLLLLLSTSWIHGRACGCACASLVDLRLFHHPPLQD